MHGSWTENITSGMMGGTCPGYSICSWYPITGEVSLRFCSIWSCTVRGEVSPGLSQGGSNAKPQSSKSSHMSGRRYEENLQGTIPMTNLTGSNKYKIKFRML